MNFDTRDGPVVRRPREVQRERVEALLEEQRRREERADVRRIRFRSVSGGRELRDREQWTPVDP